jgi:hypothetical protein
VKFWGKKHQILGIVAAIVPLSWLDFVLVFLFDA